MREIKFRAWDKRQDEWLGTRFRITPVGEVVIEVPIKDEPWKMEFISFHGPLELMQYTGLKDKNGVDIYEGDILKFWELSIEQGKDKLGEVTYDNGAFIVKGIVDEYGRDSSFYYNLTLNDLEVVGNIYENPELFIRN